jgi:hypothetical protein
VIAGVEMETTTGGPPPFGERAGLAAGLVAVSAGFLAAHFIVRAKSHAFYGLDRTKIPFPTQMALNYFDGSKLWFWTVLVVALVVAVFSLKGKLGRTGWLPVVLLLISAVVVPLPAYMAMEFPRLKIDRVM